MTKEKIDEFKRFLDGLSTEYFLKYVPPNALPGAVGATSSATSTKAPTVDHKAAARAAAAMREERRRQHLEAASSTAAQCGLMESFVELGDGAQSMFVFHDITGANKFAQAIVNSSYRNVKVLKYYMAFKKPAVRFESPEV